MDKSNKCCPFSFFTNCLRSKKTIEKITTKNNTSSTITPTIKTTTTTTTEINEVSNEIIPIWDNKTESFEEMGLNEHLLSGIYAYGIEKPSAIQQLAIMPIINNHDCIIQAKNGTHRTVAFAIGILQKLDMNINQCQSLILAPTRELAQQIAKVILALGNFMGVKIHACVDGTAVREDIRILQDGVHVVVGTPGRIFVMIQRRALDLRSVKMFVLDETDQMLERGYNDQINEIYNNIQPTNQPTIQYIVLSTTITPEVINISERFMKYPVKISVKQNNLTLEGIKQFYINVEHEEWKLYTLYDLYETLSITQAVIYCNTKKKVEFLSENMQERDFSVSSIHSDMNQTERDKIIEEFKSGSSRVLITTDLIPRPIDIQQVSLVINYDLPINIENYIHRIGRSDSSGRKGLAISFITPDDDRQMLDINRHYKIYIEKMPVDAADIIS